MFRSRSRPRGRSRFRITAGAAAGTAALALVLTGCTGSSGGARQAPGTSVAAVPGTASPVSSPSPTPTEDAGSAVLQGHTIALDPGHNGGNASQLSRINRPVPDGRGGTKPCNTTGTATADGFEEHAFNWKVAKFLRAGLRTDGAKVAMSRKTDSGVGPCVDKRGKFAKKAGADVLVSIHANGSESRKTMGFHVIVSPTAAKAKASKRLGRAMVKGMTAHGFKPNHAYGKSGLSIRSDLGGLENAKVPSVIVECGEMNNSAQAKIMKSKVGQQRYAAALADGLARYFAKTGRG